jgi:hypothetical protein
MDFAETEAEICGDFRQLPPNRQDCVLETARALSWAVRSLNGRNSIAAPTAINDRPKLGSQPHRGESGGKAG